MLGFGFAITLYRAILGGSAPQTYNVTFNNGADNVTFNNGVDNVTYTGG